MNRLTFQKLAEARLIDAKGLLDIGQHSGAYYLAGYVVECALKACICRLMKADDFPDPKFAQSVYTHDLNRLIDLAKLAHERDTLSSLNSEFAKRWLTVKDWTEAARYDAGISATRAESIVEAIENSPDGVLEWLKKHW